MTEGRWWGESGRLEGRGTGEIAGMRMEVRAGSRQASQSKNPGEGRSQECLEAAAVGAVGRFSALRVLAFWLSERSG